MDLSHLLDGLNPVQREAVTEPGHSTLVLAGAGSGKTRVLVHRIAWLMEVEHRPAFGILAVTFTNKAAGEMRERIAGLSQRELRGMWVGTFHGLSHRLLRAHWREADLPESFQILDSDDQQRLVKRIIRDAGLDTTRYSPSFLQHFINANKDEGRRASQADAGAHPLAEQMIAVYREYERLCQRSGLLDFAELLLRSYELLQRQPVLLDHYRKRFSHVLIDEFQDTNTLQYAWLRALAGDQSSVFAVGDDDQAIYGWRGARVEHIRQFTQDFPQVKVLRLEQNYRSTNTILQAANGLVAHNRDRMGKNLWSEGENGDPIRVYSAYNEQDEARFVIERIEQWASSGHARAEAAILYRSNAQSRVFEEQLMQKRIPYRIYGGRRFFDRAEIRDALAYLRLVANPHDDAALERVINLPARGIGARTLERLREAARDGAVSLWQALCGALDAGAFAARTSGALETFRGLVTRLQAEARGAPLADITELAIARSGLREHHGAEADKKGEGRVENLDELVTAAGYFVNEEEELSDLAAFLSHAALEAGEAQGDRHEDCVQLMTLHSAKGLEFDLVFLAGMEEGLFPTQRSIEDPGRLEEERRLCYVGMTRARRELYFCHAESRRLHGETHYALPSRFLAEVPAEHLQELRVRGTVARPVSVSRAPAAQTPAGAEGLIVGQRVAHEAFGEGVVLGFEGQGSRTRVQVNFGGLEKWLMLSYARLEPV